MSQVLVDAGAGEHLAAFRHQDDAKADAARLSECVADVLAVEQNCAARRLLEAGDQPHGGRLARGIGADQRNDLAGVEDDAGAR